MKNKWIECSEKLPEENTKVIFIQKMMSHYMEFIFKDTGFRMYLGAA
nr:MAG TPA: Protein of unknown function (DUF551) [Caudoviricetes sp.]